MRRPNPFLLTGFLVAFVGLYGGMPFLMGGLYPDTHEGDTYHALDVLLRMGMGQVPHLDFTTPLGLFAFLPIHLLIEAGFSGGMAFLLAQLAVAGALLPFVVYAAVSRMPKGVGLAFGLVTLGLVLALSYGTAQSGVSISMHYNRWGWAIAFVVMALAILPPAGRRRRGLDALIIGAFLALLAFLKVTYLVALAPVAGFAIFRWGGIRALLVALAGGLGVLGPVVLIYGPAFVTEYIADLALVARNEIRPYVGASFSDIIAQPQYIAGTLVAIVSLWLLRRLEGRDDWLFFVLLLPGAFYITYQNFGNDPVWLLFLGLALVTLRPDEGSGQVFGADLRAAFTATATAAFVVIFPSAFNTGLSQVKHLATDTARFLPFLPEARGHQDIYIRKDRAYMTVAQIQKDQMPGPWAEYGTQVKRPPVPELGGVSFPHCEWLAGTRAYVETHAADLTEAGVPAGAKVFVGDVLAALWIYGPFEPVPGSAPWYYGELTGLESAEFLFVPKCAILAGARDVFLREAKQQEEKLTVLSDTENYTLFQVSP